MPSPKSGTVVTDYQKAISDFSGRQIEARPTRDRVYIVRIPDTLHVHLNSHTGSETKTMRND